MSRPAHPLLILALTVACVLAAFQPAHALKGLKADGTLDKTVISKAYFEGEFWTVINALEAFRKSGVSATREDSIYAFKYLSVVYAADPETRKKGESYMYQLIKMMPTIDLLDLYISDNIESIFQKVKGDYERLAQMRGDTASAARTAAPMPPAPAAKPTPVVAAKADASAAPAAPAQSKPAKQGTGMKPWVPLAIAGVGAVASAFLLVSLKSQSSGNGADAPRPVQITVLTPNQGSQ